VRVCYNDNNNNNNNMRIPTTADNDDDITYARTPVCARVCVCVCGSARRRTSKLARGRCARVLCTSTVSPWSEDEAAPLSRACL